MKDFPQSFTDTAKRTGKDLYNSPYKTIFALEKKKTAHNVATFKIIFYLCPVVCELHSTTSRRAIELWPV